MAWPVFQPPAVRPRRPTRLMALAADLDSSNYRARLAPPLRDADPVLLPLDGIMARVEEGRALALNPSEWALAIDEVADLEKQDERRAEAIARRIWQAALVDPVPRELLLRRMALALAAGRGRVARSLLVTFDDFALQASSADQPVADLIGTLLDQVTINASTGQSLTFDILKGSLLQMLGLEDDL